MSKVTPRINKLAKYLGWRNKDFENGTIKECYIVSKNKAVRITKAHNTRDAIIAELKKLEM